MASDPEDAESATSGIIYSDNCSSSTSEYSNSTSESSCSSSDSSIWSSEEDDYKFDFDDEACSLSEQMILESFLPEKPLDGRKKRRYFYRNHEVGHEYLVHDYFAEDPVYSDHIFRKQFRMRRELFLRVVNALEGHSEYFQHSNRKGLSPLQKCTVAIRQLAYGYHNEFFDDYLPTGYAIVLNCLFKFCRNVVEVFGDRYLRKPDDADIRRLVEMHYEKYAFPGMLGSLACMHWEWKHNSSFRDGKIRNPKIVLEAVVSQDLWIWHAFFGVIEPFQNNVSALYESPLFSNVLQENAPKCDFTVNGTQYSNGYYLTENIYPELNSFVKLYLGNPIGRKRILFAERVEDARKDVERAFEVLQSRWAIVRGSNRFSYRSRRKSIMLSCIILHNMIIEDERDMVSNWSDGDEDGLVQPVLGATPEFQYFLWKDCDRNPNDVHRLLRTDLIEHIWTREQQQ